MGRKSTKLFAINDIANLRLTKDREDVLSVLNAKKMAGIDISKYLAECVRFKEGLPSNGSSPQTHAPVVVEDVAEAVLKMLRDRGLVLSSQLSSQYGETEVIEDQDNTNEADEETQAAIQAAIAKATSWDFDDD